jgi:2-amino-4-hydroxy-6-hydroxymethyldihydropteridine diphosphokinase
MTQRVYLSLGSNLGDREAHLRDALHLLQDVVTIRRVSSLFLTDPVGVTHQPEFANLAVEADTSLEPLELLKEVKRVEHEVGRRPTFRWGPRVVDIDILLYDDLVLETPELTIPHPEITRRAFVLLPLAQIAPDMLHPLEHRTIAQLATTAPDADSVRVVHREDTDNGSPKDSRAT